MDKANRRAMYIQKAVYVAAPSYPQFVKWLTDRGWKSDPHPEAIRTGGIRTEFWKSLTGYMIEIPKLDDPVIAQAALILLSQSEGKTLDVIYEEMTGNTTDPDKDEIARLRASLNFVVKWMLLDNDRNRKLYEVVKRVLALKGFKLPEVL